MIKYPILAKLFVKDYKNTADKAVRKSYGTVGGIFGIVCNLILFLIKLFAGVITGSISITADALNNLSDMGSSVVTIIGFKLAAKPADSDHPFGHGRMEYISSFVVSGMILIVGFELLTSSVKNIITPAEVNYSVISLCILIASVLIKFFMFVCVKALGKAISSTALCATAQDSINDTVSTFAIIIAMAISHIFHIQLDAYIGVGISLFILYSGLKTAKETLDPLLGQPPTKQEVDDIENIIMSFSDFLGIHDLIIHNYGPGRTFASVHVEVSENCDVVKCHEEIDLCEKLVFESLGINLVIHMDPIATDNEFLNDVKSKVSEIVKQINSDLTIHDFRMTPKADTRTNLIFDVVLPSSAKMSPEFLKNEISNKITEIDPTFCCVITVDNDFVGR